MRVIIKYMYTICVSTYPYDGVRIGLRICYSHGNINNSSSMFNQREGWSG